MNNYYDFVHRYPTEFKKARVTASTLDDLERNYDIVQTVTMKENGKTVSTETKSVSAEHYANVISGIAFFNDRLTIGCTQAGYIATRFSAKSPDGITRCIREFTFTYKG